MSEAVDGLKLKHLLLSGRHGFHRREGGDKRVAEADHDEPVDTKRGVVDKTKNGKKLRSRQGKNHSKSEHHRQVLAEKNEARHELPDDEHVDSKRHHHGAHHHPSLAIVKPHQVSASRSGLHVSPPKRLPLPHVAHMKHETDPPAQNDDHRKPHLTSATATERGQSNATTASNHLSGAVINATLPSKLDAKTIGHSDASLNYILLIGTPICALLMFGLLFLLVLKYCKCLKRACKAKQKNSTKNKKAADKMKKFMASPVGFVSNGKLFDCSSDSDLRAGIKIKKSKEAASVKSDLSKASDCRQLTINMEGADMSTEDSDEQLKEATTKPKPKTGKQTKPGMLKYGLEYDFSKSILSVSVIEARELPGMDLNGSSDPYVCVFMADNKNYQMFKTKIHKRTLNPVFNETFNFEISYAELVKQRLVLSVFDYDRLSRHDEIGQLTLQMDSIDLAQRQVNWSELRKMNDSTDGRLGDICLSLRYVPTAGRLNVVVLEARQLKKMDLAGLSDPYVKLALMSKGKRLKKKKTSIKKCTLNPHYNESFSFEIPFEQAQEVQLVITVVDYDRIGTSEPIGKITLGCVQATGETELRHWMDMLASPRRPIARWHTLKSVEYEQKLPKIQTRRFSHFIASKQRD